MLSYAIGHAVFGDVRVSGIIKGMIGSCLLEHYGFNYEDKGGHTLFLMTHRHLSRPDFYERFFKIAGTAKSKDIITPKPLFKKVTIRHIGLVFQCPIWLFQMRKIETTFVNKMLFLQSILVGNVYLLEFLRKVRPHLYKLVVTCMDAQIFDNVLTQYFHSMGAKTATLQDGHPIPFQDDVRLFSHLMPALRGFISDYYLVWGEYYKSVAVNSHIAPQRVVPLGMPKFIGAEEKTPGEKSSVFGVMLDHTYNGIDNAEMIEIANHMARRLGLGYVLRFHPSSDASAYDDLIDPGLCREICPREKTVSDFLDDLTFAIGCTSAIMIEALLYCDIVMRKIPGGHTFDYLANTRFPYEFRTKEEALALLDELRRHEAGSNRKRRQFIEAMCGKGSIQENYERFFAQFGNPEPSDGPSRDGD